MVEVNEPGAAPVTPVLVGPHEVGAGPLVALLGPCVLESREGALRIGEGVGEVCARLGLRWVFKASFDKANRSSVQGFRGPGLERGLEWLAFLRERLGVPVVTDVHTPEQAAPVAAVVDLLQVPAFLCRQTDLLAACGETGRPVNVKKGQFLAPEDMAGVLSKLPPGRVMLTERGVSFGYHELVVDFRGLRTMRALGAPVCFDCTHSVQRPGAGGKPGEPLRSGGDRRFAPVLARAAAAVGIDALFAEVHDAPEQALSDGPNMLRLSELEGVLRRVLAVRAAAG